MHLSVPSHDVLSAFMAYFDGNVAREINRLHDWSGHFWAGRFVPIWISGEPAAQLGRLAYILSQGVKEGLVYSPLEWPGIHAPDRAGSNGHPS